MKALRAYSLRLERDRRRLRALRKSLQLQPRVNRAARAKPESVMLFATLRNEMPRLQFFLSYYRNLGVGHFCFVDNGSTDGGREYLESQHDCSLWLAKGSYRDANFGMDWLNHLLGRLARNRWVLVVDVDELFVYPHCDTRAISALTHWLDVQGLPSYPALLLDMYPRGPIESAACLPGDNPIDTVPWFDAGNYSFEVHARYRNLWIRGGPRQRAFFAHKPEAAPALNKIPLVKWQRGYAYVSSTHALLPSRLNLTYDTSGGEKPCGCLLHTKLMQGLQAKASEEVARNEHFAGSREYRAYLRLIDENPGIWTQHSSRYQNWQTLAEAGLISAGGWI